MGQTKLQRIEAEYKRETDEAWRLMSSRFDRALRKRDAAVLKLLKAENEQPKPKTKAKR